MSLLLCSDTEVGWTSHMIFSATFSALAQRSRPISNALEFAGDVKGGDTAAALPPFASEKSPIDEKPEKLCSTLQ